MKHRCKEVYIALCSGEPCSLPKKISLNLHLLICKNCRAASKHLIAMKDGFINLFKTNITVDEQTVKELEREILKVVNPPKDQE